jgi:guanine deaminase
MSKKCIIGNIVHSLRMGALEMIERGAIIYSSDGVIEKILDMNIPSSASEVNSMEPANVMDFTGKLIIPGFVDAHCHAPQYVFTGTGVDMDLMEWLQTYTFPVESRFQDLEFAKLAYGKAVRRHLKSGTTFASYYATIHKSAALVLATILAEVGQRAFVGKVAMDRNSPDFYIEPTAASIADSEDFVRSVLSSTEVGKGFLEGVDAEGACYDATAPFSARPSLLNRPDAPLVLPCITPRFVPTCTPAALAGLGGLSHRYGLPVQSHLSESLNEIAFVKSLHPEASTYAGVYHANGLLHFGTIMGHCIHCSEEELALLRDTKTSTINCASSNFLLGSGIMDVRRFLDAGVAVGLGTDVAGGASASMLDCMRNTISASRAMGFRNREDGVPPSMDKLEIADKGEGVKGPYRWLTTNEAFHLATQGGADALGMGDVVGNFTTGKKLDCLVVDVAAEGGPIDVFGGESVYNHFEKFVYLGDDRNIQTVIVDGKVVLG